MRKQSSSTLTIDLEAVRSNIYTLSQKGSVMAMVKANAYGTGARGLIPHLVDFGVKILGLSHVSEAIALREAGVTLPLFVISAPPFEAENIAEYGLQPAVSSFEEAVALDRAAREVIPVHLQVNTGMNRFGLDPDEALELAKWIESAPGLRLEGVMMHFACADRPEYDSFSRQQIARFESVVDRLPTKPRWIHAANGPAALRFDLPFCNLQRIGSALFGYGFPSPLKPALTLTSHLSYITERTKGETIGYGRSYKIESEKMRLGIVPIGYYDGYHRHYKSGYVLVQGKRAPIVGNICMDFTMIDLTDIPEACLGDSVMLFGAGLSPEEVAEWGETDVRELLSSIGPRTERIYDEQRLPRTIRPIEKDSPDRQHHLPA